MEMEISKRVSEILFIPLSLIEPIAGIEGGGRGRRMNLPVFDVN